MSKSALWSMEDSWSIFPKNTAGCHARSTGIVKPPHRMGCVALTANFMPCSMIEYGDELEGQVGNVDNLIIGQEAILDKIRTKYRNLVMDDCGKKYMLQCMPSNKQIPPCALARTHHMVQRELGGYDSLIDKSESSSSSDEESDEDDIDALS